MSSSINDVKNRHQANLFKLPNVVSVGVGLNKNGKAAIIIGVNYPNEENHDKFPSVLEGYPVEIRMVGSVKFQ